MPNVQTQHDDGALVTSELQQGLHAERKLLHGLAAVERGVIDQRPVSKDPLNPPAIAQQGQLEGPIRQIERKLVAEIECQIAKPQEEGGPGRCRLGQGAG